MGCLNPLRQPIFICPQTSSPAQNPQPLASISRQYPIVKDNDAAEAPTAEGLKTAVWLGKGRSRRVQHQNTNPSAENESQGVGSGHINYFAAGCRIDRFQCRLCGVAGVDDVECSVTRSVAAGNNKLPVYCDLPCKRGRR